MEDILRNIIYILATGVGVVLVNYILKLINNLIDEAQTRVDINKYQKLNQYIDNAQAVLNDIVLTVSQTYVDVLQSNGKFDEAAQTEAKNKAMEIAKKLITEESENAIVEVYGDLEEFLNITIESLVKQNKDK